MTTLSQHPSIERRHSLVFILTKWDSFTPRKYKINLVRTLAYRYIRICSSPRLLQFTLDDLKRILLLNGYPMGTVKYHINDVQTVRKKKVLIVLPFLGHHSKHLTKELRSCINKFYGIFNLKIVFQNTRKIKSFFPYKDKLATSFRSKVVYRANCRDCNDFYIGKTKHRLRDRKTEHFKVLTAICHESAIADHVFLTNHRIKWDHFEILATGRSDMYCKIKESLFIRDLKPALNESVDSEKLYLYY